MAQPYDVIVVGLGAMGSAAAFHLARRGQRVLGLEQFEIPNTLGSSHGQSRMIRLAYYEHSDYVPLLRRAYELWDELGALAGQKLLHRTGGIYMGPPTGHVVSGATRAAQHHGLAHEFLDRHALKSRFPIFDLPDDFAGVWEPEAGFLSPEKCILAHVDLALRHDADLRAHEAVLDWSSSSAGVTVRTAESTYHAGRLVFCSGAWTAKLLGDLSVRLQVTRQVLGWVWPKSRADRFQLGRFPVWGIEQPDGSLAYGFPILPDFPGLKIARHAPGIPADPDLVSRTITPVDQKEVQSILCRYLPEAAGPVLALRTCLYTNSPDSHFLLDRLPGHGNVYLAAGFSGHGFKFSSVMGLALADLAVRNCTDLPIGFLSLGRFNGQFIKNVQ